MLIGLVIIIVLLVLVLIFGYRYIKQEKYKETESWNREVGIVQEKLNQTMNELLKQEEQMQQVLKEKEQDLIKATEENVEEYRKQLEIKINAEFCEYNKGLDEVKEHKEQKLQELQKEIETFRSMRESINQEILREREIKEQEDFFKIQLTSYDKEDIELLRGIEPRLNNKEALNKLIYEVFYKKPLSTMLNNVLKGQEPCGIYRITNQLTGEMYVGKSTNIKRRWTDHIKASLNIGTIARTKIHSAIKDNGIENFTWEVLEECAKEEYTDREKFYIDFYQTNKYGYNQTRG